MVFTMIYMDVHTQIHKLIPKGNVEKNKWPISVSGLWEEAGVPGENHHMQG